MTSDLVQRWILWSRDAIHDQTKAIPLIDCHPDLRLDLDEELHALWRDGDDSLYNAFVNAMLESPADLAVRFAALNAYYLLAEHKRSQEDDDMLDHLFKVRMALQKKLKFFVGFQSVENCTDLRTIRWEVVNSCAADDYPRAYRLCDRLQALLPHWEVCILRGRIRFVTVFLPLADDRPGLNPWALPIGPQPLDYVVHELSELTIIDLCVCWSSSRELAIEISLEAKAQLSLAIAEFQTAPDEQPPTCVLCHLMLARACAAVGQNQDAARRYEAVLERRDEFTTRLTELFCPPEGVTGRLSNLFQCLVTSHQRAEEIDAATIVAQRWIDELPCADAYPLMARLYELKGDVDSASQWFRQGEERFPELGNDWKTSLILKLGETRTIADRDKALDLAVSHDPLRLQPIKEELERSWPPFIFLDTPSRERWAFGVLWARVKGYETTHGIAVHCFAWVIERALRSLVFLPFKDHVVNNPGLLVELEQHEPTLDRRFLDFLGGKTPGLALGEMFEAARRAKKSGSEATHFAQWMKRSLPVYFGGIGPSHGRELGKFRNQEVHSHFKHISEEEAVKMFESSKELIEALLQVPTD